MSDAQTREKENLALNELGQKADAGGLESLEPFEIAGLAARRSTKMALGLLALTLRLGKRPPLADEVAQASDDLAAVIATGDKGRMIEEMNRTSDLIDRSFAATEEMVKASQIPDELVAALARASGAQA